MEKAAKAGDWLKVQTIGESPGRREGLARR